MDFNLSGFGPFEWQTEKFGTFLGPVHCWEESFHKVSCQKKSARPLFEVAMVRVADGTSLRIQAIGAHAPGRDLIIGQNVFQPDYVHLKETTRSLLKL